MSKFPHHTKKEGFGECDGEIGIGLSVGRGGRLTPGKRCRWAAADSAGFFSGGWRRRRSCPQN